MKLLQNMLGGLAGAIALNVLHETFKRMDSGAPRIDLVGEEALSKTISFLGYTPPVGNKLFAATLGADVASNAVYYSLVGQGKDKHLMVRGAAYGLAAALGAIGLTKKVGLDDTPVNRTTKTKVLTVAWYLVGGLVAGAVIRSCRA